VEHSSSSATALITDARTVQVFAQGVIVCVIVTARALVTVLCYLCVLKCLFIIIIIINIIIIHCNLTVKTNYFAKIKKKYVKNFKHK